MMLNLILLHLSTLLQKAKRQKIKSGQIWEYTPLENPWKPQAPVQYKIIDVKNGFVLYRDTTSGQIDSNTIDYFLVGSKLIKP